MIIVKVLKKYTTNESVPVSQIDGVSAEASLRRCAGDSPVHK